MNKQQQEVLYHYGKVYRATKEWDTELDMIKLRLINESFKAIYAEQGI